MKTTLNTTDRPLSNLTELQLKLLSFYREYNKQNKRYPRLIEAAEALQSNHRHISARAYDLVNKGYMTKLYDGMFALTRKK